MGGRGATGYPSRRRHSTEPSLRLARFEVNDEPRNGWRLSWISFGETSAVSFGA